MRLLSLGSVAALFAAVKAGVNADLTPQPAAPAPLRGEVRRRRVRRSNFERRGALLSNRQARAAADRQTHERQLREYRRDPIYCAPSMKYAFPRDLRLAIEDGLRDRLHAEVTA